MIKFYKFIYKYINFIRIKISYSFFCKYITILFKLHINYTFIWNLKKIIYTYFCLLKFYFILEIVLIVLKLNYFWYFNRLCQMINIYIRMNNILISFNYYFYYHFIIYLICLFMRLLSLYLVTKAFWCNLFMFIHLFGRTLLFRNLLEVKTYKCASWNVTISLFCKVKDLYSYFRSIESLNYLTI